VTASPTFAQLVSLACHDLRTPLATASGFAHTLQRLDALEPPGDRYVQMIGMASAQMGDLLDLLGAAARVEAGRFEAQVVTADSRELADGAAAMLEPDRASVEGTGVEVRVDPKWVQVAIAAVAECVRRHGALDSVTLSVDGAEVSIGPVGEGVAEIAFGRELKDFGSAVATKLLETSGVALEEDGDRLVARLPQ